MSADRTKVVVRVRKIVEDQANGVVAIAQQQATNAAQRAQAAHDRCHVHPALAMGAGVGAMTANALAASAGAAAALLSAARSATDAAERAEENLGRARANAAEARSARLAAERLAERREELRRTDERRTAQRNVDETVSARHTAGGPIVSASAP